MYILKTCFCLLMMMTLIYCMNAEDKYANGIILRCEKDESGSYSYFLNSKLIGVDESGMNSFLAEISKLPDYSIIIVSNLNESERNKKAFFKDKKFAGMLTEIENKKHHYIVFFEKGQFDYSIQEIDFVYIHYIIHTHSWERMFFLNAKSLGTGESGYSRLIAGLDSNNKKFIFVIFTKQGSNVSFNVPDDIISGSSKIESDFNDSKRNYYLDDMGSGRGPVFHDYQVELKKSQQRAENVRVEAEVVSLLPDVFNKVIMTEKCKTLSAIIAKINSNLKPSTSYIVLLSCPDMNLVFDCESATISTIIKYLCTQYRLRIIIENNKIILKSRDDI